MYILEKCPWVDIILGIIRQEYDLLYISGTDLKPRKPY